MNDRPSESGPGPGEDPSAPPPRSASTPGQVPNVQITVTVPERDLRAVVELVAHDIERSHALDLVRAFNEASNVFESWSLLIGPLPPSKRHPEGRQGLAPQVAKDFLHRLGWWL